MVRSQASALLENGSDPAEIRAAISPDLKLRIGEALSEVRNLSTLLDDLPDDQHEKLRHEVASFVALTGGGWPAEQRTEYIDHAVLNLADIPVSLLAPAIRAARRRVWDPKRFVSWIWEAVEPDMQKLEQEQRRLERLAEIAD